MKILPINNYNQQTKMQNFRGLWGESINNDRYESEYYIYDTKYPYYPFADETPEQIEKVKQANDSYREDTPGMGVVASPWQHVYGASVTVMAALPFTSKEFLNYTMNKLSIAKQKLIEEHIISKGLSVVKK